MGSYPTHGGLLPGTESTIRMGTRAVDDGGRTAPQVGLTPHLLPTATSRLTDQHLMQGLVTAIEPVISAWSGRSITAVDGWTVTTTDGSPSAHFEHTVVITPGLPNVVT